MIMTKHKESADYAAQYAGLISQIGCTTSLASVVIIGIAFGAGWLLDNWLGTHGIFTVLFLVGSFPVTLYVILRLALSTAARAQKLLTPEQDNPEQEEAI